MTGPAPRRAAAAGPIGARNRPCGNDVPMPSRSSWKPTAAPLLGFLTQMLRDPGTAEDVLQQVLLEVWQRAENYDPDRASLLTWVLTIARSRALDELRRRVPEPLDPAVAAEQVRARAQVPTSRTGCSSAGGWHRCSSASRVTKPGCCDCASTKD